jgi:hypothetical protein
MAKKTMAYAHKGAKVQPDTKSSHSPKEFDSKASMAPMHKPKMVHAEPAGPFQYPKNDEQSMKLEHKKKALPLKDAPKGVAGPNGGKSMPMPKSGGLGEGEV